MDEGQKLHNRGGKAEEYEEKGMKYGENEVNKSKDGKWKTKKE